MPLAGHFETTDGAVVVVGAFKANPLQDICNALEIEDLSKAYPDMASQVKNKAIIQDTFRKNFALNTKAHWLARLEEQDILCAPVRSLGEALDDPQTTINNMLLEMDHPILYQRAGAALRWIYVGLSLSATCTNNALSG